MPSPHGARPLPSHSQTRPASKSKPSTPARCAGEEAPSSFGPGLPRTEREGSGPTQYVPSPGSYARRYPSAGGPTSASRGRIGSTSPSSALARRSLPCAADEAEIVGGPQPPPQWNNPRANPRQSCSPTPLRAQHSVPLLFAVNRSTTPPHPGRSSTPANFNPAARRGNHLTPAGSASAFACSPFALVPPTNMSTWPRKADVPPLFLSRNGPPSVHRPQEMLHTPASSRVGPPNSLETLNAARPQRVAMRDSPDEPSPPMPRDPLTSVTSHHGTVTDEDLFRGGRALVPSSMDSVSTRMMTHRSLAGAMTHRSFPSAMTHRSMTSARGPGPALPGHPESTNTEDDPPPSSAKSVNPYLPLYPGAGDPPDSDGMPRGLPLTDHRHAAGAADRAAAAAAFADRETQPQGSRATDHPGYFNTPASRLEAWTHGFQQRPTELSEAAAALGAASSGLVIGATAGTKAAALQHVPVKHSMVTIDALAAAGGPLPAPPPPPARLTPPLDLGPLSGIVEATGAAGLAATTAVLSGSSAAESGRVAGKDSEQPRAVTPSVTPSARTLGLQSTYGSASDPALPAVHAADSHTQPGSHTIPPLLRQLSASTPKALLGGAAAGRSHSNPPSSGPPSSSLGSPTSLEQLLPAQRHAFSHSMHPDGATSVGTLGTVTFAPTNGRASSVRSDGAPGGLPPAPTPMTAGATALDLRPHAGEHVSLERLKTASLSRPMDCGLTTHDDDNAPSRADSDTAEKASVRDSGTTVGADAGVTWRRSSAADKPPLGPKAPSKGQESVRSAADDPGRTQRVRVRAGPRYESDEESPRQSFESSVSGDLGRLRPKAAQKPRRLLAACCLASNAANA